MSLNLLDSDVPVMLELLGMQSTPYYRRSQVLSGSGVEAPNKVLSIGQIELNCVPMLN